MVDTCFANEYQLENVVCSNKSAVQVNRLKIKITDNDGTNKPVDRQMLMVTFEGNILPNKIRKNFTKKLDIRNYPVGPLHPSGRSVLEVLKKVPKAATVN